MINTTALCREPVKGSYKAHDMLNKEPQASSEHKSPNPIDPASGEREALVCHRRVTISSKCPRQAGCASGNLITEPSSLLQKSLLSILDPHPPWLLLFEMLSISLYDFVNQINSSSFKGVIISADNVTPFRSSRNRKIKLISILLFASLSGSQHKTTKFQPRTAVCI